MEVEKTPPPCPEKKTRAAKFFVLFYWAPSVRDVRFKLEPTLKGIKNLINHNQLNKQKYNPKQESSRASIWLFKKIILWFLHINPIL